MASSVIQRGNQKLNPINVKDPEVQNNLELVSKNFNSIFARLNKQRFFVSGAVRQISLFGPKAQLVDPALTVSPNCTGSNPVDVFLIPDTNTFLSTQIVITPGTTLKFGIASFQFYRNGAPFKAIQLGVFANESVSIPISAVRITDPTPPQGVNVYTLYAQPLGSSGDTQCAVQFTRVALAAQEYF